MIRFHQNLSRHTAKIETEDNDSPNPHQLFLLISLGLICLFLCTLLRGEI